MNLIKNIQSAPADPFAAPAAPAAPAPAPSSLPSNDSIFSSAAAYADPPGLSGQDWVIALAIIILAGVAWYFVRGAVQTALAKNHVAPDAAVGAGWTLFAFLMALTATMAFGLVGSLWTLPFFLFPAFGLTLVLFVLTIVMVVSALGRRR